MKIGIVGAGHIGGTLRDLWTRAGHSIRLGTRSEAGSVADAITFGNAVVFAAYYGAWPQFAADYAPHLAGKILIDAANPYPERDGEMATRILAAGEGSALPVARLLPGAKIAKAFNSIYWVDLRDQAGRGGERLAMPIAGDDADALATTRQLAAEAGFDPVVVGGLREAIRFDPESAIYAKSMTAAQVRETLGLPD